MRILVVCSAGASSTFVAMRLRRAAQSQGIALHAVAGTRESLPIDIDSADILLLGPHLRDEMTRVHAQSAHRSVPVLALPDDVFSDLDGTRTLDLVRPLLSGAPTDLNA